MINLFQKVGLIVVCGSLVAVDCSAGFLSWLKKEEKDRIESMPPELVVSNLLGRIGVEQDAALQAVRKSGVISQEVTDKQWFGDVKVKVKADYEATYGFSFGFIEKGLHIEKNLDGRELFVLLDAPRPLSVAVDTKTICVYSRDRNGLRKWAVVPKLKGKATKWLSEKAEQAALEESESEEVREAARKVIQDMVLDLVGELSTKRQKRALADRIHVIYTDELSMEGVEEIGKDPSIIVPSDDL